MEWSGAAGTNLTVADMHRAEDDHFHLVLTLPGIGARSRGTVQQKTVCVQYVCLAHFFSPSLKEHNSFIPCQVSILIPIVSFCLGLGVCDLIFFFSFIVNRRRHRAVMAAICRLPCPSCWKVLP